MGIGGRALPRGDKVKRQRSWDAKVCPDDGRARVGLDGPHRPPEQTPQCAPALALDTRTPIMPCGNEHEINDVRFAGPPDNERGAEATWELMPCWRWQRLASAAVGGAAASDKKAGRPSPSDGHPALCAPLASDPPN